MPDTTTSGRWSSRPVIATWTQSVGVPLTERKPRSVSLTDSGRFSVSECEAPLWFCSGATTVTSPSSAIAPASAIRPGAK